MVYSKLSMKKKIIILIVTTLLICVFTFLGGFNAHIDNLILKRLFVISINLLNGVTAFVAIKLTGVKIGIELKNFWQYLIGLGVALTLSLFIAFIPAWCGHSLVGSHANYDIGTLIYAFFFFLLVIGPVEELVFRVYYQATFMSFFNKHKWIGVIIASALFGLWHLINGSPLQVLFTFGIGLVFGFAKYFIKQYKYLGLAFTHGLYDFLNIIVTMFVI